MGRFPKLECNSGSQRPYRGKKEKKLSPSGKRDDVLSKCSPFFPLTIPGMAGRAGRTGRAGGGGRADTKHG